MRLVQVRGPFEYLEEFEVELQEDEYCTHFGIQLPWVEPLQLTGDFGAAFSLNGGTFHHSGDLAFYVNEKGMLEFDELKLETVRIKIVKNEGLPADALFEFGIKKIKET